MCVVLVHCTVPWGHYKISVSLQGIIATHQSVMFLQCVITDYSTVCVCQINHWELYLLILHERPVALSPPQAMTRKILKVKVKMLWLAHLMYSVQHTHRSN